MGVIIFFVLSMGQLGGFCCLGLGGGVVVTVGVEGDKRGKYRKAVTL